MAGETKSPGWVRQAPEGMTCTGRPSQEPPCSGTVQWVQQPLTGEALCEAHHKARGYR